MAGVVEGFRWALLGRATGFGPLLGVSVGVVLLTLVTGAYYFRRTERLFADII
jgi:lipopolysaccharide transport system permease protein